jgi:S-formylglutathione hydrolase FrmB
MNYRQFFLFFSVVLLVQSDLEAQASRDTTFILDHRLVTLRFPPKTVLGTILMLPGWNFSKDKTCESSTFCEKALQKGFVLICPEMGKSVYASQVFSNTRKDWAAYPQLAFITDTLQPYIQKTFHLLNKGQQNFVFGISTGARGAALILENTSAIYKGGALLSGDYDQTMDTSDNLMKGYYGSFSRFKDRWEGSDNPMKNIERIQVPLYIGHGKNDLIVNHRQSDSFNSRLQALGKKVVYSSKEKAGHNYTYWESETSAVLKFFLEK